MSALGDLSNWVSLNHPWWDLSVTNDLTYEPVHTDIINHISLMRKIVYGVDYDSAVELIKRRRAQLFVHCHIYYQMGSSLISDHQWQKWANDLVELQSKYPGNLGFYDEFFEDWDGSTGFHLVVPLTYRLLADQLLRNKL